VFSNGQHRQPLVTDPIGWGGTKLPDRPREIFGHNPTEGKSMQPTVRVFCLPLVTQQGYAFLTSVLLFLRTAKATVRFALTVASFFVELAGLLSRITQLVAFHYWVERYPVNSTLPVWPSTRSISR